MGCSTPACDDHDLVVTTMRRFQQAAHGALDEAHTVLNGVRATGIDDQDEACRRSRHSYVFVKILSSQPGLPRVRDRVKKRRPESELTRCVRSMAGDDRSDRWARITASTSGAIAVMLDRQLRRGDRYSFEHAFGGRAIGRL